MKRGSKGGFGGEGDFDLVSIVGKGHKIKATTPMETTNTKKVIMGACNFFVSNENLLYSGISNSKI